MNIQIGENTYNQTGFINNDYEKYTYSKNVSKTAGAVFGDAVAMSAGQVGVGSEIDNMERSMVNIPDSTLQKNYMVVMSNTMSESDFANLEKEGFKVGEMEPGEMVTITDRIKTRMAESGQVIRGYNDDMDSELLEEITGSTVYAEAISNSFNSMDVPFTEDNIVEGKEALDMASKIGPLDDKTIEYMVANNIQPTIKNLYMAEHSGAGAGISKKADYYMDKSGYVNKVADANDYVSLDTDVKKLIESMGQELSEENIDIARNILASGSPLSQDSFGLYKELKSLKLPEEINKLTDSIANAIKNGKRPMDAAINEKNLLDEARDIVSRVSDITDDDIASTLASDKPLTLMSLENAGVVNEEALRQVEEKSLVSANRLMNEIRLSMTVSSTYVLLKNNISVDTTELSKLVDELREAENRQFESVFGKQYVADKEKLTALLEETNSKVTDIKDMPIAMAGRFVARSVTLNVVYSEGLELRARFQAAGQEYEKMFTEVRADLGDSIKKAFRNAGDILSEMGLEVSSANEKAVRILGYNQMSITEASIENVKSAVGKLENVINKMQPANTLRLIREGINPLEISLEELEKHLDSMDKTDNEPERFSVFLNRLDESKMITEDERQSFIGIYRLINSIEKNDSQAVGSLINSRAEINFSNLLSAVRSGKHHGMDIQIGDDTGVIEETILKGISISEQIGKAYHNADAVETARQAGSVSEEVAKALEDMELGKTPNNLIAADALINKKSSMYKDIKKNIREAKLPEFKSIARSIVSSFTDKESAVSAWDDMADKLRNLVNSETTYVNDTIDLKSMSFSLKQMFVASRFARDEYYEVPMEVGEESCQVSVRITHGNDKGVRISLSSEAYGQLSGRFRLGSDGYEGLFQVDGTGKIDVNSKVEELMNSYQEASLNVSSITFTNSSHVNLNVFGDVADTINTDEDNISTADLYQLAKVFIETLGDN